MPVPADLSRKHAITLSSASVGSGGVSDFSVMLQRDHFADEVVDPSSDNAARSDGGDIRFSLDSAGTSQLACDVIAFEHDTSTGAGDADIQIRVNVPSISSVSDTTIYVWYAGTTTTAQPAADDTYGSDNAYNPDWLLYLPFEEDLTTDNPIDRTANQVETSLPVAVDNTQGIAGNAGDFTGQRIALQAGVFDNKTKFSVCLWNKPQGISGNAGTPRYYEKGAGGTNNGPQFIYRGSQFQSHRLEATVEFDGQEAFARSNTNFYGTGTNNWHHLAMVFDGADISLYIDGVKDPLNASTTGLGTQSDDSTLSAYIGNSRFSNQTAPGPMDDFQYHTTDLTDAWIATEYNQTNAPATFATPGTPEEVYEGLPYTKAVNQVGDVGLWWKLHDTSGTVAVEETYGQDAEYVGGVTLGQPPLSPDSGASSVLLNGSNGHVTESGALEGSDSDPPRSLAILFRTTDTEGFLFGTGRSTSSSDHLSLHIEDSTLRGRISMSTVGSEIFDSEINVADGKTHLAVIAVGATTTKMYLDGQLVGESTLSVAGGPGFNEAGWVTKIGETPRSNTTTNSHYAGHVEHAIVFNKEVSLEDVERLWNGLQYKRHVNEVLALTPTGFWTLDDDDSTITDISGNLNHGTYYNSPTQQQPPLTNDPSTYSVYFQGEGQYGEIGIDFDLSGDFALGFLFKGEGDNLFLAASGTQTLLIVLDENDQLAVATEQGPIATSTKTVADGDAHYAIIIREDNTLKLYVDGVLEATGDAAILTSSFSEIFLAGNNFFTTSATLDDLWYIEGRSISEEQALELFEAAGFETAPSTINGVIDHDGTVADATINANVLVDGSISYNGDQPDATINANVLVTGTINYDGSEAQGVVNAGTISIGTISYAGDVASGEINANVLIDGTLSYNGDQPDATIAASVLVDGSISHDGTVADATINASLLVDGSISHDGTVADATITANTLVTGTINYDGSVAQGVINTGTISIGTISYDGSIATGQITANVLVDGSLSYSGTPDATINADVLVDGDIGHDGTAADATINANVLVDGSTNYDGDIADATINANILVTGTLSYSGSTAQGTIYAVPISVGEINYDGSIATGQITANNIITINADYSGGQADANINANVLVTGTITNPGTLPLVTFNADVLVTVSLASDGTLATGTLSGQVLITGQIDYAGSIAIGQITDRPVPKTIITLDASLVDVEYLDASLVANRALEASF